MTLNSLKYNLSKVLCESRRQWFFRVTQKYYLWQLLQFFGWRILCIAIFKWWRNVFYLKMYINIIDFKIIISKYLINSINFACYVIGVICVMNFVQHNTPVIPSFEILCYMHHFEKKMSLMLIHMCIFWYVKWP
jgi:hypothetical protein